MVGFRGRKKAGISTVFKRKRFIGHSVRTVDVVYDQEFEADIVHVSNQDELLKRLNAQQKIMLIMLGMTTLVVLCLIVTLTRNLMGSINRLVETMKIAGKGKLSVRAVWDDKTPTEIRTIETQFNIMLDKLERSVEKEKRGQRKAKECGNYGIGSTD